MAHTAFEPAMIFWPQPFSDVSTTFMTYSSLVILLVSILFLSGISVLGVLLRRSAFSKEQPRDKGPETAPDSSFFKENLRSAGLTTRLQQSRLTVQQNSSFSPAPERYRYVQSLFERGLSAEDIAAALSMSRHETTQIIALIRIANPRALHSAPPRLSPEESTGPVRSAPLPDPMVRKPVLHASAPSEQPGVIHKSIKLARWLKIRAASASRPKQGGREPPRNPLPNKTGLLCDPLSGYI
jgi:hypothetical protein